MISKKASVDLFGYVFLVAWCIVVSGKDANTKAKGAKVIEIEIVGHPLKVKGVEDQNSEKA